MAAFGTRSACLSASATRSRMPSSKNFKMVVRTAPHGSRWLNPAEASKPREREACMRAFGSLSFLSYLLLLLRCEVALARLNHGPKFSGRTCRDWCQA